MQLRRPLNPSLLFGGAEPTQLSMPTLLNGGFSASLASREKRKAKMDEKSWANPEHKQTSAVKKQKALKESEQKGTPWGSY